MFNWLAHIFTGLFHKSKPRQLPSMEIMALDEQLNETVIGSTSLQQYRDDLKTITNHFLDTQERSERQHIQARTNRNRRTLKLLRGIEMFGGNGKCPVCGSPNKWQEGKKPSDKQRKDLHHDKCELSIMIDHFESCIDRPGVW